MPNKLFIPAAILSYLRFCVLLRNNSTWNGTARQVMELLPVQDLRNWSLCSNLIFYCISAQNSRELSIRKSLFKDLYDEEGRWLNLKCCLKTKLVEYAQSDETCMNIEVKICYYKQYIQSTALWFSRNILYVPVIFAMSWNPMPHLKVRLNWQTHIL